jgi:hypothetical protein
MISRIVFLSLCLSLVLGTPLPVRAEIWSENIGRWTQEVRQLDQEIQVRQARLRQLSPEFWNQRSLIEQRYFQLKLQGRLPGWGNPLQARQNLFYQEQAEINELQQRYQEAANQLTREIGPLEDRRKAVLARIENEQRTEQARRAEQERRAAEEARRQRELAAEREQEARRQAAQREREQRALEAEQQRQLRALELERQRQAQALAAQQEQERQEALRQQKAYQEARELAQASVGLHRLAAGFSVFGILLAFLPAYREYALDRLGRFWEWDFRGWFLVSFAALSLCVWILSDGLEHMGWVFLAYMFGGLGLPAGFFLPGLVLLVGQYLHYLFVPHPAEDYIRRSVRSNSPSGDHLRSAADAMYDPKRDGLFDEWRAKNRERRLRAVTSLVKKENDIMDELIRNQKKKSEWRNG